MTVTCYSETTVTHSVWLHVFKLLHPLFGVSLSDLPQGLVLVTALLHVLSVQQVQPGLLALITRGSQVCRQRLQQRNASLLALGTSQMQQACAVSQLGVAVSLTLSLAAMALFFSAM